MKSDIKLDPLTHDLLFENDDLVLFKTEQESITQRLKIGLGIVAGEWFLDISAGVPMTAKSFSQKGSQTILDAYLRRYISTFGGVQELLTYSSEVNKVTRQAHVVFTARSDSGEILSFSGIV